MPVNSRNHSPRRRMPMNLEGRYGGRHKLDEVLSIARP
jgi:hypothetical protein